MLLINSFWNPVKIWSMFNMTLNFINILALKTLILQLSKRIDILGTQVQSHSQLGSSFKIFICNVTNTPWQG